jgi:lysophospholipase L1-like esterase
MLPDMTPKRTNVLLALCTTLACLLLLEFGAAVMFDHMGMTNGKRLVLSAIRSHDRFVGVKDGAIVPHPYMLYTTRPGFEQFGFTQINALGYRGREIGAQKPAGTYRVMCLGGSTTFCYPYIQDPARAWPGRLEAGLNRHYPGGRFEVLNAGLPYATSAELLAGYMFRHRYMQADLVIIHEGGNDTDPLMFENYDPEYTHFRAAGIRVPVGRIERPLLRSHLFRVFFARYWRDIPSVYIDQPYGFEKLSRDAALRRVKNTYPLGFERNLDLLVRTVLADGARVMLVGFVAAPVGCFAKSWPWMEGLEPAVMLGIEKNLRVMETIAGKYGVPYLSPATVSMKDEWFIDGCHLTEEGEQRKADWILAGVTRLFEGVP